MVKGSPKSGKYIKAIRTKKNLTQKEFASIVGIEQSHVSRLERDIYDISLSKFLFFCSKLKIKNLDEILKINS